MKNFLKEIEDRVLIYDGSKGYMLQKSGLKGGECGELWNITNPDTVSRIYKSYLKAGSDVIQANTFPGNRIHLQKFGLGEKTYEINYHGARLAKEAAGDNAYVCAPIGPSGLLLEPSGELTFEYACEIYREQVKAVAEGGADIINFETFSDLAELRAACFAAKDTTGLPVVCSLSYGDNGRTLMGTDPFIAVNVLKGIGADMVGTNCSFGPDHMTGIVRELHEAGGGFLSVKPNAGLPHVTDGIVIYDEEPSHFAEVSAGFVRYGARLIGGCCGTTPEFIEALKARVESVAPSPVKDRARGIITSNVRYLDTSKLNPDSIGMLDATKDSALRDALAKGDLSFVEDTVLDMASEDWEAVYVNVDAVQADDRLLSDVVNRAQWYLRVPLIIGSRNSAALDSALRIYRGTAGVIIGDDTGCKEALAAVAFRYGSVAIDCRVV